MTGKSAHKNKHPQAKTELEAHADEQLIESELALDAATTEAALLEGEALVFELQEDILALQQELEGVRSQASEYLEGWQRARADFANYKKRIERDQELVYQNAAGSITRRYLEILDDLDLALKNCPQTGEGAAWASGIELIYRKLLAILESDGVKPMQLQGAQFDPNMHEAISMEDSPDHESGQVIDVIRQGYLLGDRVLRPAIVRIAK